MRGNTESNSVEYHGRKLITLGGKSEGEGVTMKCLHVRVDDPLVQSGYAPINSKIQHPPPPPGQTQGI